MGVGIKEEPGRISAGFIGVQSNRAVTMNTIIVTVYGRNDK